ncbi:hypothetical protein GQ457_11G005430 [Hibiscus cannabinus]
MGSYEKDLQICFSSLNAWGAFPPLKLHTLLGFNSLILSSSSSSQTFLEDDGDDGHRENGGELEIQTQELEDDEETLRQGGEEREHEGRNQKQESPQAHPADPQACRFPLPLPQHSPFLTLRSVYFLLLSNK